jgi:hypothetical protein
MFASSVCERVMPVAFLMVGKGNRGSSSYFLPFLVFLEVVACDGLKSVAVAVGRVEREARDGRTPR